jgi:hypothetical protein
MKALVFSRRAFGICAGFAALSACAAPSGSGAAPPINTAGKLRPYSQTFDYTGKEQTFTVPASLTKITVVLVGARGAGKPLPALGGRVWAIVPVTAGEKLAVFVGGEGSGQTGGFNGGADGGGPVCYQCNGFGGGGASDVRQGGDAFSDRILVAGGGGGRGSVNIENKGGTGGAGGGTTGGSGIQGGYGYFGGGGGGGGTQAAGGSGGSAGQGYYGGNGGAGANGGLAKGGRGGNGGAASGYYIGAGGGGGGGGYYGGGGGGGGGGNISGGGAGGGGGGGSSYIESTAYKSHSWQGWKLKTGDGEVIFEW